MASVVAYERWLTEQDPQILAALAAYNREDVRSTHDLHGWLEERRTELEAAHGPQPRPAPAAEQVSEERSAAEQAEDALAERARHAGWPLLAGLVSWHRREDRPRWWELFRLADLDEEQLVDDGTALGAPSTPVRVGVEKRSVLWRYEFPPQDTKLAVGKPALDVDTGQSTGTVHALDPVAGELVIKLGARHEPVRSRGFAPPGPIGVGVLQTSIATAAEQMPGPATGRWPGHSWSVRSRRAPRCNPGRAPGRRCCA